MFQIQVANHFGSGSLSATGGWSLSVFAEGIEELVDNLPKRGIALDAIDGEVTNSGKHLAVGTTGFLVPVDAPSGGSGITVGGTRVAGKSIIAAGTGSDDYVWARDANANMKGLSANGGPDIGTTTLGKVGGNSVGNVTPSTPGLMPVPHPNQSSTPSGTGEVTFSPQSTASTFRCDFSSTFGWNNSSTGKRGFHMFLLRKIGSAAETVVFRGQNWLITSVQSNDFSGYLFYVDAPNTTETVRYRWCMMRNQSSTGNDSPYPNVQSASFVECPNKT